MTEPHASFLDREPLLTDEQEARLLRNGTQDPKGFSGDHVPVVRFFDPMGPASWLITAERVASGQRGDHDHFQFVTYYGLADLGFGSPEAGEIDLIDVEIAVSQNGGRLVRDDEFDPRDRPLSFFEDLARKHGHIVIPD